MCWYQDRSSLYPCILMYWNRSLKLIEKIFGLKRKKVQTMSMATGDKYHNNYNIINNESLTLVVSFYNVKEL